MKTSIFRPPPSCARSDGVALVLVLGFLVLISVMIVAFFTSVSTEVTASGSYAAGVTVKQLSETATNMVIGEITDATQGYIDPTQPTSTSILSWASQPGMIRTYEQSGAPYRYYKLYSAENMVMTRPPVPLTTPSSNGGDPMSLEFNNDVPQNWATQIGLYTDLNAPVLVPDPTGTINAGNGTMYRADYPIVDPSAMGPIPTGWPPTSPGMIEGFQINTQRIGTGNPSNPAATPTSNPAPMPCRWLYVLKDGTVLAPSSASGGKVTFEKAPLQPSPANPIVGRIAFWTDDETCKVNLNTAGEGTFWDQPRGAQSVATESNFAADMPGQNEFQRFPGHPAMTCLSTVFENLNTYWQNPTVFPLTSGGPAYTSLQHYFTFAPRLVFGGSQGGSVTPTSTVGIPPDHDRLFASVDEIIMDNHYPGTGTPSRAVDANLKRADLEKLKFFLTVNSRAPEVNLFNKPRIGLWPIQVNASYRNPKDQLLAFCTSTGTGKTLYPYYFQRQSVYYPGSGPNSGYNGITSFNPTTPSSQSTWIDFALSGSQANNPNSRNTLLYAYLRNLTGQNIPGFGGSFQGKYDQPLPNGFSDRDQILTEMYDMIRVGVNTYSDGITPYYDYGPTSLDGIAPGERQAIPTVIGPAGTGFANSSLVSTSNTAPTAYTTGITKGFGRFNTIYEVAIVFFTNGLKDTTKPASATNPYVMQAAIIMDPFNPTPGLPCWSPNCRCAITGLGNFTITDKNFGTQSLYFPDATPAAGSRMPWNLTTARVGFVDGNHSMSINGLMTQFHYFQANPDPPKAVGNDGQHTNYPFVTQAPSGSPAAGPLVTSTSGSSFEFSGGLIKIQIFAGYEAVANGASPRNSCRR